MSQPFIYKVNEETSLIFGGVEWTPLIGSNLVAQSAKIAAAKKATHFVSAGDHSSSVGTIKIAAAGKKAKRHSYFSAAAIFAQSHRNGVVLFRQVINEELVWVVGAHDGVIFQELDVVVSSDEADVLLEDIKSRYKGANNIASDAGNPLQYLTKRTELIPVLNAWEKIPKGAKIGACVVMAFMLLDAGWGQYSKMARQRERTLAPEMQYDAVAEWKAALNKWATHQSVDGRTGFAGLFEALTKVPMKIDTWNLAETTCNIVKVSWSCSSRYEAGINSTNLAFSESLPEGWTAQWVGLTGAVAKWSVPATRSSVDRKSMIVGPDFDLHYVSALQKVLPAFLKVEVAVPKPVAIPEPKVIIKTTKGEEVVSVPYPQESRKGLEIPQMITFKITGPLRSFSALPMIRDTTITKFRFVVGSGSAKASLRESLFAAELTGDMYVR